MTKNQSDCKKEFEDLCAYIHKRINEIDKGTPYSVIEPQWWLDMMELKRQTPKPKKE